MDVTQCSVVIADLAFTKPSGANICSRSRHGQTSVHVAVTGKHLLRSHKGLSLSIAEKFLEIALSGLAVILLLALGYARRTG